MKHIRFLFNRHIRRHTLTAGCVILSMFSDHQAQAQQLSSPFEGLVCSQQSPGAFPLVSPNEQAVLCFDADEDKGVIRAITDLQADIKRVTGREVRKLSDAGTILPTCPVLIGTVGASRYIDQLVKDKNLNASDLKGKWESYVITTVEQPFAGTKQALVIAGSDRRGTIYGIYELSKQLGVSPWYWWADVPVYKRETAFVTKGYRTSGEPKIRYRGIFINDEIPCMTNWAKEKFGGMNSKMYTRLFELLLRLKANCLWPGMWGSFKEYLPGVSILKDAEGNYEGNCFNEDDPENPRLANEYGIIMGTSHHEPMQRSQQEWLRHKQNYGNGEWNYQTNKKAIQRFFREGIQHTKDYESIITMGMRGDDDKPMADAGSAEANFKLLEGIMRDQRRIIREVTGKPASQTPQVWTLYSEVLEYYDQGMHVPDDMIIMLCDDNWGDVRRLPPLEGKRHPGGYGMYYHVGLYGAPRAYKWLNMTQIQHIWEQMQLTYSYGVDKIWMLNVGDLKPCEFPTAFFLDMAWNPTTFTQDNLMEYTRIFCQQQFGKDEAEEAARILNSYCKYSARVTAEMLNAQTYNLENGEFKKVTDEFMALEARALRQFMQIADEFKDAYKQLVLFPVQAMANLYELYYSVAMNHRLAAEKDLEANHWADYAERCFKRDEELCADYNRNIAHGKWNHMMDQVHIGYKTWHGPQHNIMPEVIRVQPEDTWKGGYAFTVKNNTVVMEAEHFYRCSSDTATHWAVIPDLGRTRSGIALFPYDKQTQEASLTYKMKLPQGLDSVKVRLIFDSTLPFISGGHKAAIGFIGTQEKEIDINSQLTWKNNYSKMYPAAAARINEIVTTLSLPQMNENGYCFFRFRPLAPGIVLHKVIIDCGGYENTYLKMNESPYSREKDSCYLFTYFTADRPDAESIYFALSEDGYNYKTLNSGNPVIKGDSISDKGGVRAPHILRGKDGSFLMVATDMKVSNGGWESNHGIVMLKSKDLIHWSHTQTDLKALFPKEFGSITRAWAPQTIYDEENGKYMIYFSMKRQGEHQDILYYAYANPDFTAIESTPRQLFFHPSGKSCIDGDIVYKDGKYHLFFKTEGDGNGIKKAVSEHLTHGYVLQDNFLQQTSLPVEGSCVFKLSDQDKYILMYDVYKNKKYEFTESRDLGQFHLCTQKVNMDFSPRHGTVIPITREEADRLTRYINTPL